ncbi:hypothetical protein [Ornithinibacillus bavariensis]|uniref:hypothetical protein n=1 Tax=Ornithinibacillus bavariensis TaxID=545502 RepID=UPI000EC41A2C|nr:hypothetical protein [Ornithinibacillus sp.]
MSIVLSADSFQKAHHYLMKYGRDLEQELYRFYFENGHPNDVIRLLAQYQADNGGFRNMGEGDVDFPNGMDTCMAERKYRARLGQIIRVQN